ncbi:MAG: 16S rRNA (cytosine(1402)-N(4))-methyltransferase RsmH [Polyangiaceae bacterium]|nr:16S rRNA (cytosine(1402)-N(4))-methyltransferase RsmH [Polyangiaceae bacterium]
MPAFTIEPPTYAHTTVMVEQVVGALQPGVGGIYVDATVGGGGHSAALLEACRGARVVAFDRDTDAVAAARERLSAFAERVQVIQSEFADIERHLDDLGITAVDGLVADLGVSSHQLDDSTRGMSFRAEGPLDMRMDLSQGRTARELIEQLSQEELASVIYQYGEERRSRRVARCVKQALRNNELRTTLDLRRAVVRAVGPHRVGGIDPATRTFQALRIAVNEELKAVAAFLRVVHGCLSPGGRVAILTFHSGGDRRVKKAF